MCKDGLDGVVGALPSPMNIYNHLFFLLSQRETFSEEWAFAVMADGNDDGSGGGGWMQCFLFLMPLRFQLVLWNEMMRIVLYFSCSMSERVCVVFTSNKRHHALHGIQGYRA